MKNILKSSVAWVRHVEHFCHTIVKKTYPFTHRTAEGKVVMLEEAYNVRAAQAGRLLRTAPYSRPALPISAWADILSLWLSIFFWMAASALERLVGMPWGLIMPILVIVYFLYQELYIDAELGRKNWLSTLVDSILWTIPSLIFIFSLVF